MSFSIQGDGKPPDFRAPIRPKKENQLRQQCGILLGTHTVTHKKSSQRDSTLFESIVPPEMQEEKEIQIELKPARKSVHSPTEEAPEEISLEYHFKDSQGNRIGTDVVKSIDVVEKSIKNLHLQLEDRDKRLRELDPNDTRQRSEINQLKIERDCAQKAIQNLKKLQSPLIDSNYHRNFLKRLVIEKGDTQTDINKKFKELNRSQVLTAPVNMHYQYLEVAGRKRNIHFVRLGIISDHRNGFVSLPELIEFKKNLGKRHEKIQALEQMKQQYKNAPIKIAAIQYAIDEISTEAALDQAIIERKFILEQQSLQLLEEQISHNLDQLKQDGTFDFAHVSFLNPKKHVVDSSGWCHDEKTEISDMRQALKNLEGRKILLDVKAGGGSYIDIDGIIHMARPDGLKKEIQNIAIGHAIFANISVQGHMKNDGIQKEINKEAITAFRKIAKKNCKDGLLDTKELEEFKKKIAKVKALLKSGQSSYLIAEMVEDALITGKIIFSHGCLSGKDRTGFVGYRTIYKQLIEGIDKKIQTITDHTEKKALAREKKKIQDKYRDAVFDIRGNAVRVAKMNTGAKTLKVTALVLPGMRSVKGFMKRILYYVQQATDMINTYIKTKQKKNRLTQVQRMGERIVDVNR